MPVFEVSQEQQQQQGVEARAVATVSLSPDGSRSGTVYPVQLTTPLLLSVFIELSRGVDIYAELACALCVSNLRSLLLPVPPLLSLGMYVIQLPQAA